MNKVYAHSSDCDSMDDDPLGTGEKPCNCYVGELAALRVDVEWLERENDELRAERDDAHIEIAGMARRVERLRAELEQAQAHRAVLCTEVERLRGFLRRAPHDMGCDSLRGGPSSPGWGSLDRCNCVKSGALGREG